MKINFIPFDELQRLTVAEIKDYIEHLRIRLEISPKKPKDEYLEILFNYGTANGILVEKIDTTQKGESCKIGIHSLKTVLRSLNQNYLDFRIPLLYLHLGNLYNSAATIEKTSKNCNLAIKCHKKALRYFKKIDSKKDIGNVYNNLGNDYVILGQKENCNENYKIAIGFYYKSLQLRKKTEYPLKFAETQNNLGNAYRLLCRIEKFPENSQKAIECYSEALSIYEEAGLTEMYQKILKNYHSLLEFKKNKDFEMKYLKASIKGKMINSSYEVFAILGEGGFGKVCLAFNHDIKAVVALKTYRNIFLSNSDVRERFSNEAKLWIELRNCPYILRAYLVDEINKRLVIVMEYITKDEKGRNSLNDYIGGESISIENILKWSIEFCFGMEYANRHGIKYHGDIKPTNILITPYDKRVKISDFGLANYTDSSKNSCTVIGTAQYMAPEIFSNPDTLGVKSDIYSVGIVLYELITNGAHPFTDFTEKITNNEYTHTLDFWSSIHNEAELLPLNSPLEPIIRRCLQKNPDNRYQNFQDLRLDLERIYQKVANKEYIPVIMDEWKYGDLVNKGISFDYLQKFDFAIECYKKAIQLAPNEKIAYANIAYSLNNVEKPQDAIEYCDRAILLDSNFWIAYHNKGNALHSLCLYEEAIACYDKALNIAPWAVQILIDKALCLCDMGRFNESLDCCNNAIDINPEDPRIYDNKGLNYYALGDFARASDCFDIAIGLEPCFIQAIMNKALALAKSGKKEEAIKNCLHVLELDANHRDAIQLLGILK